MSLYPIGVFAICSFICVRAWRRASPLSKEATIEMISTFVVIAAAIGGIMSAIFMASVIFGRA